MSIEKVNITPLLSQTIDNKIQTVLNSLTILTTHMDETFNKNIKSISSKLEKIEENNIIYLETKNNELKSILTRIEDENKSINSNYSKILKNNELNTTIYKTTINKCESINDKNMEIINNNCKLLNSFYEKNNIGSHKQMITELLKNNSLLKNNIKSLYSGEKGGNIFWRVSGENTINKIIRT